MKTQVSILCLIMMMAVSCNFNKKEAKMHFEKSEAYFNKKDWNNASKEIEIAIKLDSANLESFYLKAKILSKSELYDEAIKALSHLISKNYKSDSVNFLIAKCYFNKSSYYHTKEYNSNKKDEALKTSLTYIDEAIKINRYYFDAHNLKQRTLFNLNSFEQTIIALNNALNIFPNDMRLVFSRGVVKEKLGDKSGAIIDLSTSINSNKLDSFDLSTAYRFRGLIYSNIDSLQNGIDDCTKSIQFDPESELSYLVRAGCFRKLGQMDKACEDYRKSADFGYIPAYEFIKQYCE
jgi:Tfp pilus assembly protein PilF